MKVLNFVEKIMNDFGITVFAPVFQIIRDFFEFFEIA